MSCEAINQWFKSRKPALIENLDLRLRPNNMLKDIPLSVQRGQSEVFFLESDDGKPYILKHFHDGKRPDIAYVKAIGSILPPYNAFICATTRKVLSSTSLKRSSGTYFCEQLAAYLENDVLMPEIPGLAWTSFLGQIRDRKRTLTSNQRLAICNNLALVVKGLENHQVSHRDLSGGNVFIDPCNLDILLIDFDSLYHPCLKLSKTTIGSEGYIASFVQSSDVKLTYCSKADRFAMAILCVEFLILDSDSPFSNEGGIFEQGELHEGYGRTISYAKNKLRTCYPQAMKLFERAIHSKSFNNCPAPDDWIVFSRSNGKFFKISIPQKTVLETTKNKTIIEVQLPDDPWKERINNASLQNISRDDLPDQSSIHANRLEYAAPILPQFNAAQIHNNNNYQLEISNVLLSDLYRELNSSNHKRQLFKGHFSNDINLVPMTNVDFKTDINLEIFQQAKQKWKSIDFKDLQSQKKG